MEGAHYELRLLAYCSQLQLHTRMAATLSYTTLAPRSNGRAAYGARISRWGYRFVILHTILIQSSNIASSVTTLERRFAFSSTQIGLFTSIRKGLVVAFVVPLAHFANKGVK